MRRWLGLLVALALTRTAAAQFPNPPGTQVVGVSPGGVTPSGLSLIGPSAIFVPVMVDQFAGLKASGVTGDGTDDTPAIQAAENATPAGGTLRFTAGKIYTVNTAGTAAGVLKVVNSHVWDLTGATIKYGGAGNLTTGSDGAAIPVLSIQSTPFRAIAGVIDGNSKVGFPVAIQGAQTGGVLLEFVTIQNTLEASSAWNGIAFTVSRDVSGITITGARAQNVSGVLIRPNCPVINAANTIVAHQAVSAVLVGGSSVWGNATGNALVNAGGTESAMFNMTNGHALGVPQFIDNAGDLVAGNVSLLDFVAYDGGFRRLEMYGAILAVPTRQTFSVGGTFTPSFLVANSVGAAESAWNVITVSANVAVTIADPTATGLTVDRVGDVHFVVRNTSGGALTTPVTFTGASYRVSGTVSPPNGQQITVNLMYDKVQGTYQEISRSVAVNN